MQHPLLMWHFAVLHKHQRRSLPCKASKLHFDADETKEGRRGKSKEKAEARDTGVCLCIYIYTTLVSKVKVNDLGFFPETAALQTSWTKSPIFSSPHRSPILARPDEICSLTSLEGLEMKEAGLEAGERHPDFKKWPNKPLAQHSTQTTISCDT